MAIFDPAKKFGVFSIRKKIGRPDFTDPGDTFGIYRVRKINGKVYNERMAFYQPTGSPGPGQLIQREKMRVCVANWNALFSDEKNEYKRLAKGRGMTGLNLYLHDCLRFVVLPPSSGPFLLLESGDFLLLEDSGKIILNIVLLLAEDGDFITTESGNKLIK